MKSSKTLEAPWGTKIFLCLHFLFVGKELLSPRPSLSSEGQIQTVNK